MIFVSRQKKAIVDLTVRRCALVSYRKKINRDWELRQVTNFIFHAEFRVQHIN